MNSSAFRADRGNTPRADPIAARAGDALHPPPGFEKAEIIHRRTLFS
jgi:hypothetical protein